MKKNEGLIIRHSFITYRFISHSQSYNYAKFSFLVARSQFFLSVESSSNIVTTLMSTLLYFC